MIIKDTQEPIWCNKCQEYRHIQAFCINEDCSTTCARPHDTSACSHPNDHRCVSYGISSDHSSSDKENCPQFAKHYASLDMWIPENTLPYFPVLGSPWMFIPTAKPTPHHYHLNANAPAIPNPYSLWDLHQQTRAPIPHVSTSPNLP